MNGAHMEDRERSTSRDGFAEEVLDEAVQPAARFNVRVVLDDNGTANEDLPQVHAAATVARLINDGRVRHFRVHRLG